MSPPRVRGRRQDDDEGRDESRGPRVNVTRGGLGAGHDIGIGIVGDNNTIHLSSDAASLVALAVVCATRPSDGPADRPVQGSEWSVADRLVQLRRWIAQRLPDEEGAELVGEAGRSPDARALLRRQLALTLREDSAGLEELRALLAPHAPFTDEGCRFGESLGIPRQLPPVPADFTGRRQEVARTVAVVERGDGGRSCLIHGPGGMGKTAVAVRAAHQLVPHFPDGQLFVDLNGADGRGTPTGEVLGEFLLALGTPSAMIPDDTAERTKQFRTLLASRRVLVVLDNAATEQQVSGLIPGGPSCGVLITSRHALATMAVGERIALSALDDDTAWDLLLRIGGADRVDEDAEAGREVVRLCGGLPLALRIVGARLATFPARTVRSFARDLADDHRRLDVLSLGERSVRAAFLSGLVVLPPLQQRAFRLLSALDAPDLPAWALSPLLDVDADAAEVCLEGLLLAHFVQARRGEDGGQRVALHDLARAFSTELARAFSSELPRTSSTEPPRTSSTGRAAARSADEAESAVRRLLEAYLSAADAADAQLRPAGARHSGRVEAARHRPPHEAVAGNVWEAVRWFEAERAVLLAGISYAHSHGWWELCWEITDAMSIALEHQWRWETSRQVHELALEAAGHLGDVRARAALLRNLGEALRDGGSDQGKAADCFTEAIALFHSVGDAHGESDARGNLGILQRQQGALGEAAGTLTEAETLFRALSVERGLAWTLREKAVISRQHARYPQALSHLSDAQALFTANAETRGIGWILRTRADTERECTVGGCPLPHRWYAGPWPTRPDRRPPAKNPRWAAARTCYEDAAQILYAVGDHRGHAWTTLGLADMALHEGDRAAAELTARALQETAAHGDHRGHSRALTIQALLHAEANRLTDAIALAKRALADHRDHHPDHTGAAQAAFRLARLYGAAGRHHDLLDALAESRSHHRTAGMPFPGIGDAELATSLARPVPRTRRMRWHR